MRFYNMKREDLKKEKKVKKKNKGSGKVWISLLVVAILGVFGFTYRNNIYQVGTSLGLLNFDSVSTTSYGLLESYKKPSKSWIVKDGQLLHLQPTVVYISNKGQRERVSGSVTFDGVKRLSNLTRVKVVSYNNGSNKITFYER